MRIRDSIIIPLPGEDVKTGKPVPAHSDYVILRDLAEGKPENPKEEQKGIEEFEKDVRQYNGYLAVNENFETGYIPPYDDIAAVIRHKLKGNKFVIVDLSKVDKTAFIKAERITCDNSEDKSSQD